MKMILSAMVVLLGISSITLGQYKKRSVEDKLIQLDKAWTRAELTGDKKAAAELIADDYAGTTQRGEVENKTQYLASVVPNADIVKADDYKVTIYGNTAIMTHRSTVSGVRNIQFRSTHVWMKRNGKWQIVAHHGSQITPPIE
ncbi:MAG: nuclear transport factor 2 family protein [Pyrinomonadaceae bacterium]